MNESLQIDRRNSQVIDDNRHEQQICHRGEEQQEERQGLYQLVVNAQIAIQQLEVVEEVDYLMAVLQLPGHRAAIVVRDVQQTVAANLCGRHG